MLVCLFVTPLCKSSSSKTISRTALAVGHFLTIFFSVSAAGIDGRESVKEKNHKEKNTVSKNQTIFSFSNKWQIILKDFLLLEDNTSLLQRVYLNPKHNLFLNPSNLLPKPKEICANMWLASVRVWQMFHPVTFQIYFLLQTTSNDILPYGSVLTNHLAHVWWRLLGNYKNKESGII